MDVFSHGLWTGALAGVANKKMAKPLKMSWSIFWGMMPDVLAFAPMTDWTFWSLAFGNRDIVDMSYHEGNAVQSIYPALFNFTNSVYNVTHSLAIFLMAFALAYAIFGRPIWEMGGWLLHILIDIPTHSAQFFPTPFLWPFSDWKFDGMPWSEPQFLIINWALLACVYYLFLRKRRRAKKLTAESF